MQEDPTNQNRCDSCHDLAKPFPGEEGEMEVIWWWWNEINLIHFHFFFLYNFLQKLINATTPDKSATEHTRRDSHGNLKPVPTEEKELTANVEEEPDLDESLIWLNS